MWIELHSRTRFHPKTKKLARRLGIPKPHAVGYLVTLWMWVVDMADDGDLSRFDEEDIEDGAEWDGKPGLFVAALVVTGFLDELEGGGLAVHDWREYAKFLTERERKQKWRDKKRHQGQSEDVPGQSGDVPSNRTEPTVPNRTNQTEPTVPTDLVGLESAFKDRFGSVVDERTAMQMLESMQPFTADDFRDIRDSKANCWLYVARMLNTERGKRSRRLPPKRADEERFVGDHKEGVQQVLDAIVAAKSG